jgi:hypothetical protein
MLAPVFHPTCHYSFPEQQILSFNGEAVVSPVGRGEYGEVFESASIPATTNSVISQQVKVCDSRVNILTYSGIDSQLLILHRAKSVWLQSSNSIPESRMYSSKKGNP